MIATGSGPAVPPIPGLAEARPWGNREATTAKVAPESLVILGGGVVGVELAQAWSSLGTKVVLLEGAPRVIVREEPFASAEVAAALVEAGVAVRTESRAVGVSRDGDEVVVELADGPIARGAELLVAVGRKVNTSELGLETVGLEPGEPVEVGSNLRSPGRLALCDRRRERACAADAHGQVPGAARRRRDPRQERLAALRRPVVAARDLHRPAGGGSRAHARLGGGRGMVVRAVDVPTSSTAGSSFVGRNTPGTSRLVIDDVRGVVAGATFVGFEVGEMLHSATIAVVGEVPLDRLIHAVPTFPTRSELWLKLLEAAGL